jgi:hypothetical protein
LPEGASHQSASHRTPSPEIEIFATNRTLAGCKTRVGPGEIAFSALGFPAQIEIRFDESHSQLAQTVH